MASSDRTPGPWHLQPMGNGYRVLGGPRQRIVASVPARRLADGQLITAAPDLLAVCVVGNVPELLERAAAGLGADMRGTAEHLLGVAKEMRAAVTKAKGESGG